MRLPAELDHGSSPRGRGTQPTGLEEIRPLRFIPARAGNAHRQDRLPRLAAVHPRAGGERLLPPSPTKMRTGSSPRGRGTLVLSGTRQDDERFIPARAARALVDLAGELLRRRFIPARAGNAVTVCSGPADCTVHPRAGGERCQSLAMVMCSDGSSPRGRGTRGRGRGAGDRRRFIPARAGNAYTAPPPKTAKSVHPRAGGEREKRRFGRKIVAGSSPRGRGTRPRLPQRHSPRRFIPARAGNALAQASTRSCPPVHPRAGGERPVDGSTYRAGNGSSPRGRGTLDSGKAGGLLNRFIPARAGNAAREAGRHEMRPVHPRARRGTPMQPSLARPVLRFIPARAGNASIKPMSP